MKRGKKMDNNINLDEIQKKLHNHTEDLVVETLAKILEEKDFENVCTCQKCLLDMCTYALNRLPAKYVASYKGEVYTKVKDFEQQSRVDIMSEVIKAIEVVSENPHNK